MIDSGKKISSFIFGGLIFALGLLPLLANYNIISFSVDWIAKVAAFGSWILALGGLFILIDAHLEDHSLKIMSTIIGLLLIGFGLIEILYSFGTIGFHIPFLSETVFYILFVVEGLFLIIGAFAI